MNIITGDLLQLALDGQFDVIIHGCNCQCAMGKGIAKSIKTLFPEAYQADKQTKCGSYNKLGTISYARIIRPNAEFTVVNGYIQFDWRGSGAKTDYDALRLVMRKVKHAYSGSRIGYPLIGAGLAGGDWTIIKAIIEQELTGENHTLVEYSPK